MVRLVTLGNRRHYCDPLVGSVLRWKATGLLPTECRPFAQKNVDSGGGSLRGIAYSGSNNMPTRDQLMNIIENHWDAHTRQIIHHSNPTGWKWFDRLIYLMLAAGSWTSIRRATMHSIGKGLCHPKAMMEPVAVYSGKTNATFLIPMRVTCAGRGTLGQL